MTDAIEKRRVKWPLRVALSLVLAVEALLMVLLIAERDVGNLPTLVNAAGLLVLCVLTWREIPWSRWLLIAFLSWRVVQIVVVVGPSFRLGDVRSMGSLQLLILYVVVGSLVASPLGRPGARAAT